MVLSVYIVTQLRTLLVNLVSYNLHYGDNQQSEFFVDLYMHTYCNKLNI